MRSQPLAVRSSVSVAACGVTRPSPRDRYSPSVFSRTIDVVDAVGLVPGERRGRIRVEPDRPHVGVEVEPHPQDPAQQARLGAVRPAHIRQTDGPLQSGIGARKAASASGVMVSPVSR